MKTYNDVVKEFEAFKSQHPDDATELPDFAKQMDAVTGAKERTEAYDPSTWTKVNAWIDRAFDWTPAPGVIASPREVGGTLGEAVGSGFDRLTGTHIAPTLKSLGAETPRMVTEGLLTAPLLASGAGAPVATATWANRLRQVGKVLGYGSAFTRGTAETGSLAGGAVSAGSLGLGNVLIPKAGAAAERGLTKMLERGTADHVPGEVLAAAPTAIRRGAGGLANAAAGAATATGVNEATRQGMLSAMPDEMRTEGDRNPFTEENIAGNVAGAAFFAPQVIGSVMHGGPKVSPKQTEQLATRLQAEAQASGGATASGPVTRQDHLMNILEQSIENRKKYAEDGRTDEVSRLDTTIGETYNEIMSGRYSDEAPIEPERLKAAVDDVVKFQPPDTPEKFQELSGLIRENLNFLNEGRTRYESELAQREASLNTNDKKAVAAHEAWKTEQARRASGAAGQEQTWHPQARAAEVLDQTWKSGDLPPLSEEWLKKEWGVTFDETGNPTMSNQVLAQKMTNYYADRLDAAVAAQKGRRQADTSQDVGRSSGIDEQEQRFIGALSTGVLPKPVLRGILERTREIRNSERIDPRSGQAVTRNRQWQLAVSRAVESYDPTTETILLPKKGTSGKNIQLERVPASRLIEKKGQYYAWEPQERRVTVGEGGKRVGEDNIEALRRPDGEQIDIGDEEAYKRALAEQSTGEGIFGATVDNADLALDPTNRLQDPVLDAPDEATVAAETQAGQKVATYAETLRKNLKSLSDEQLWQLAEPLFKTRTSVQKSEKRAMLRTALVAALENMKTDKSGGLSAEGKKFLQAQRDAGKTTTKGIGEVEDAKMFLRNFFQTTDLSKGASAELLRKLVDEGTVARVKSGGPMTKAQEGVNADRVEYDRLQKEMAALGREKAGTPEYNKLWQASEDIKNRNDGMPPGEVAGGDLRSQGAEGASGGTQYNRPSPGNFTRDVARTLRTRINSLLGRAGYSGTVRDFYTELAVSLAQQGALPNLDFYRVGSGQYGLAAPDVNGRSSLGINVDRAVAPGSEAKVVMQLVQTLAHEIGHLDGFLRDGLIPKPDAYSEERARLVKNFDEFGRGLTDDERAAMLSVVQEYVPEPLRNNIRQADGQPYGTSNVDEFAQQMRGHAISILAHETPQGRAVAKEMMDHLPQEVRELYRDTFRSVKDIMETMRQATEDPQLRALTGEKQVLTGKTDPFILSRSFETMLDNARNMTAFRYADRAMAEGRAWVTNADRAPNLGMTNAMWFAKTDMPTQMKAQESMPHAPSETSVEAVGHARDFMNGPRAYDKTKRLGLVGRFLAPFRQEMWALERNGNTAARPIADTIFQLEPGTHRILSNLLGDFMKRGNDGSVKFDAENPLIARISRERTGPFRDAINRISKWQQGVHEFVDGKKLDAQSLFVQNEKGELVANPQIKGAEDFWNKTRASLSKEDQQFVASQSFVLDRLGQRAREILTTSIAESNVNRATALVMATNKGMDFNTANRIAKAVHDAFLSNNVASLGGTIPPPQMQMLQRLFTGEDGKSGLIQNYLDVIQHFENRPGYRSESLPHTFIVRYRNASGEVKFDSRPTEGQAQALAKSLQQRGYVIDGEIINKSDANRFSPTDDPDGILTKVSEKENFVWSKFIEDMTKKHGTEFGNELAGGYTPMEQTMKDVSAAGVGKFLKERKNFVDRDSFDYIDSSLAYAQRLSYAVAVRSMKQKVELLLNEPSVRQLPSFQALVRGHVSEMLRPQSQTLRELKGITSGMMIAGNLSSAVMNATQSLQTLLPVLDLNNGTKGGFVKPWVQLGRAIADATDFTLSDKWHEAAKQTKGVDPTKWTEDQTVAELWRRQIEAGGFSHTVVDDIAFGQDQRLLMNAKFGRGDYGPVTKASLLRSGAYIANQFAMLPFRKVEQTNAKVAFLAGVRQAYEQGLRGDAAYSKAAQTQGLATFGGGRANSPGLQTALSKGFTPGGAGLALALQQYGFGMIAIHGQFVRDSLGKSKNLSAAEVWHARRAYGTFLMTQTALAGVLGMPLVGATLTALEKVFGIPANQAVRNGLASLSEDDETGAMIAEMGLNGLADYWTGLDVSSRLGTSSLLGTSSYRGFNFGDMAGPAGSILENGVKSLGYFGQGEPMKAATALAPNALKKALEMTDTKKKYGDYGFRDKAGNLLYMPTDTQVGAYALGFRPRELSRRRQMQSALTTADTLTQESRDRALDQAAQGVLRGDMSGVQRLALEAADEDPKDGPTRALRAIMDRAVAATTEKDFLATGSRYNTEERSRIYRTFGPDVQHRRSETAIQDLRMQLAAQLGDPRLMPTGESYKQATVIDSLISDGSMPRAEAVRLVQMLGL